MSHGFYLTYDGPYPPLSDLHRFWESATADAELLDSGAWQRTGDVVEQAASAGDLIVELNVFLDGECPREVSIEGHWSEHDLPAGYLSVLASARSFAAVTGGRLEHFDAGATLP